MSGSVFLTNHARVLACIARDPEIRLREIADCVGVTERATHRIVCELEHLGYLTRERVGRRNVYRVDPEAKLDDESGADIRVGDLLELLSERSAA